MLNQVISYFMHICYVDESGTPDKNNNENTNHFVLAGISIPIINWRDADKEISSIKNEYGLTDETEIHTAYLLRDNIEQRKIHNFIKLDYDHRKKRIKQIRDQKLTQLKKEKSRKYSRYKKNMIKLIPIHI